MKLPFAVYSGFDKSKNFGDWWLFEVICDSLRPLNVVPLARKIPRYGVRKLIYRGWKSRLLPSPKVALLGGGTIMAPISDDSLVCMQSADAHRFTVGSGAKSVEEWEAFGMQKTPRLNADRQKIIRDCYETFDAVTVRGPISQAAIKALGVTRPVEIVGDPFLGLVRPNVTFRPMTQKRILVNLANLSDTQGHWWKPAQCATEEEMYDLLVADLKRAGYVIELLTCSPEDVEICDRVAARHGITSVRHALTFDEIKSSFDGVDAVVAVRLHVMIFAYMEGIPTAPFAYQDKHLDFLFSIRSEPNVPRLRDVAVNDFVAYCESQWQLSQDCWTDTYARINNLNRTRDKLYEKIRSVKG